MNSLNSLCLIGVRPHFVVHEKLCPFYYMLYKMENMRMPELKALAREHRLRGYSRLRKAELIAFLQDNEHQAQRPPLPPPQMSTWEPEREQENEVRQHELEAPLMKRQLKHGRNKNSKLAKKFASLNAGSLI